MMKNAIAVIVMGILILPLGVVAQDHAHHDMEHGEKKMEHKDAEVKHYEVNADFQKQLNIVYKAGLDLNNAFVADNATEAKELAGKMTKTMSQIDMSLLEGDAHMAWMMYSKHISEGLNAIKASDDIAEQRKSYAMVNDGLYKAVKSFSIGETVYYQFCPMEKSGWLSSSEEIKNPYFGSKMLSCGATKETLN